MTTQTSSKREFTKGNVGVSRANFAHSDTCVWVNSQGSDGVARKYKLYLTSQDASDLADLLDEAFPAE